MFSRFENFVPLRATMMMTTPIFRTSPSVKLITHGSRRSTKLTIRSSLSTSAAKGKANSKSESRSKPWCVYLILSTNKPIKTYVGVTDNFPRRLKQHNGELRGGAKASRAGRPWICACLVRGFVDRTGASRFEWKWKNVSRELPRNKKNGGISDLTDDASLPLLGHRRSALDKVKGLLDCTHLEIDWKLNSSSFVQFFD